jgi:isoquinoline 1-oxidoreductase subunit beta
MRLVVSWDEGANAKINSSGIWEDLRAASKKDGVIAKKRVWISCAFPASSNGAASRSINGLVFKAMI